MSLRILTTGPVVTELPLALEPVEPDPFVLGLALSPVRPPGTHRLARHSSLPEPAASAPNALAHASDAVRAGSHAPTVR